MISYIKGKIISKSADHLIIVTGGLGYKVYVTTAIVSDLSLGDEIELYLYHHVKEDGQSLYGFAREDELRFYELLITVSGVGPKSALNILASAKLDDLKAAIASGDADPLVRVSGIGRKTAERLIVELKNKVDFLASAAVGGNASGDELEALIGLGYSAAQARNALSKVDKSITDSGERLRQALKYL